MPRIYAERRLDGPRQEMPCFNTWLARRWHKIPSRVFRGRRTSHRRGNGDADPAASEPPPEALYETRPIPPPGKFYAASWTRIWGTARLLAVPEWESRPAALPCRLMMQKSKGIARLGGRSFRNPQNRNDSAVKCASICSYYVGSGMVATATVSEASTISVSST